MSLKEFVLTALGFQVGVIVAIVVLVGRLRERVVKLEEWQRLTEKKEEK